jgi:Domain of unknown function (DUF4129)
LHALLQASIPASAVRDTIAQIIARDRGFQQSVTATLFSRFWEWFSRLFSDLFSRATQSRGTYMLTIAVLAVLIAASIARAVIVARARRLAASARTETVSADALLAQARSLAAQGAFVEASHVLYAAIVSRLVEQHRVKRHPSKTVGDYGRELRGAGDALTVPYNAFSRTYEMVAYGDGLCDAARYARIDQLASALVVAGNREPVALAA